MPARTDERSSAWDRGFGCPYPAIPAAPLAPFAGTFKLCTGQRLSLCKGSCHAERVTEGLPSRRTASFRSVRVHYTTFSLLAMTGTDRRTMDGRVEAVGVPAWNERRCKIRGGLEEVRPTQKCRSCAGGRCGPIRKTAQAAFKPNIKRAPQFRNQPQTCQNWTLPADSAQTR